MFRIQANIKQAARALALLYPKIPGEGPLAYYFKQNLCATLYTILYPTVN